MLIVLYIILFIISIGALFQRRRVLSVLLFTFFVARGLSIIPIEAGPLKLSYLSFAYIVIFVWYKRNFIVRQFRRLHAARKLRNLMIFFITSICFSIAYYGFPFLQTIMTGMRYLVMMSFFVYLYLNKKEFDKLYKVLFYITFFTSVLYIGECITGKQLLAYNLEAHELPTENGLYRFYNIPPLLNIFIYISLFYRELIPKRYYMRILSPIVFLLALFLSNGRTAILVFILTSILISLLSGMNKKSILGILFIGVILFATWSYVGSRMEKGGQTTEDITLVIRGDFSQADYQAENGYTLLYRFAWIKERLDYLHNRPFVESLFGLGLLPDESPIIQEKYHFRYGIINLNNGYISQIRTPDIAWGNFLTCYGFLGTIFYFIFYFSVLKSLKGKKSKLSSILWSIMLFSIVGSLTGADLSEPYDQTSKFIFYAYSLLLYEYYGEGENYNSNSNI